jgi:hypothetical protein
MRSRALTLAAFVALVGAGAVVLTTSHSNASTPTSVTVDVHATNIEFLTASGATTGYPRTPLVTGDRVVGRDQLLQSGSAVGHDDEICTVGFDNEVVCDDVLALTNRGDLHVAWMFQWPSTGNGGPKTFDGVVDGGTSQYRNARGSFHATALTNGGVHIAVTINEN